MKITSFSAGSAMLLALVFTAATIIGSLSASAQESGAVADNSSADMFVRETKSDTVETTVSIASRLLREPGLGPALADAGVISANKIALSAAEDAEGQPEYFRTYLSEETWRVSHETPQYLSALGSWWLYTGGAHGNIVFSSMLWRKGIGGDAGSEVDVSSFFREGAAPDAEIWTVLSTHLYAQWVKEWETRSGGAVGESGQSWQEGAREVLALKPDASHAVTLLPSTHSGVAGGLAFHYGPYELGPYAMGPFVLTVPQEVFRPYLTVAATGVFGGDVRSATAD